ncbi:hypothetical protein [Caulobacter flavus]|nr:hypothetical protein [Caulobacter flavus]
MAFLQTASPVPTTAITPIRWRPTELVLLHGLSQPGRRIVLARWAFG